MLHLLLDQLHNPQQKWHLGTRKIFFNWLFFDIMTSHICRIITAILRDTKYGADMFTYLYNLNSPVTPSVHLCFAELSQRRKKKNMKIVATWKKECAALKDLIAVDRVNILTSFPLRLLFFYVRHWSTSWIKVPVLKLARMYEC